MRWYAMMCILLPLLGAADVRADQVQRLQVFADASDPLKALLLQVVPSGSGPIGHLQVFRQLLAKCSSNKAPDKCTATIDELMELAKKYSGELGDQYKSDAESQHAIAEGYVNAIAACETTFATTSTNINNDEGDKARTAKSTLCSCRQAQAIAELDLKACDNHKECLRDRRQYHHAMQWLFWSPSSSSYLDYPTNIAESTRDLSVDICSSTQASNICALNYPAQVNAIDGFQSGANSHWTGLSNSWLRIVAEYERRDRLHSDFDCESQQNERDRLDTECEIDQGRAELAQCRHYDAVAEACDVRVACRSSIEGHWDTLYNLEAVLSETRKTNVSGLAKLACDLKEWKNNSASADYKTHHSSTHSCPDVDLVPYDVHDWMQKNKPDEVAQCVLPEMPCSSSTKSWDTPWGTASGAGSAWSPTCDNFDDVVHMPGYLFPDYRHTSAWDDCAGHPVNDELGVHKIENTCLQCSDLCTGHPCPNRDRTVAR